MPLHIFLVALLAPHAAHGAWEDGRAVKDRGGAVIELDLSNSWVSDADMAKVRAAVAEVSAACPQVLQAKPTDVFVNGMTPGGTKLLVLPWCKSEHYWDVYFYFNENVRAAFGRHNIPGPKIEVPGA